jgi:hypothetical protein
LRTLDRDVVGMLRPPGPIVRAGDGGFLRDLAKPRDRRRSGIVTHLAVAMSMTVPRNSSASFFGRWKEFHRAEPPPSRMAHPSKMASFLRLAAGEDDDAAAVERAPDDVAHALGERADRDLLGLVHLLGGRDLEVRRRRLHLDDVRAELARDLRGVRAHVDGGLAVLRDAGAARVRPHDDRKTLPLRLFGEITDLPVHLVAERRGRVDREADRDAAEPERLVDAAREGRTRIGAAVERVGVVELQDERDLAGEVGCRGLDEAERRRVRVAAGVDREAEVVARIVALGVLRERARRTVLEALVDGRITRRPSPRRPCSAGGQVGEAFPGCRPSTSSGSHERARS